jgi:hypothetical protein
MENSRQYELPFGELVDKITILQLRETLLNNPNYAEDIRKLEEDIDLTMRQMGAVWTARTMRIMFLIAQLNTLIWLFKDKMEEGEEQYTTYLKLSHQVNGLKNALKNKLMESTGGTPASLRTNIKTDGLPYYVSI